MAFHPAQSNIPLSRTDEIDAKLKIRLPPPPLVNEKKWNAFMDMGVLAFSLFLEAHPTQVVTVGACSRENFDTGARFAALTRKHQVTGELVDCNLYDYELYGHEGDKQIGELFRAGGETIRVCEHTLARAHRLASVRWQLCAQKAQHHAWKGESVLYAIAGRADLYNEIQWMTKMRKTNLEGHNPKAHLGTDPDLLP